MNTKENCNNTATKNNIINERLQLIAEVCKINEKRKGSLTTKEKLIEKPRKTKGQFMKILCANQGCYVYRKILLSKVNQYISEYIQGEIFT